MLDQDNVTDKRHMPNICVFKDPIEAVSAIAVPWIKTCKDTHKKCRQLENPPLPSRVLDVGVDGDEIVLKESHDLEGAYTILSHCWGKNGTMTTTPLTLASRTRGIRYSDLPPTFQHAVIVTRVLGIRYVWIDSLCIIQGQESAEDWQSESGKMMEYYKNAHATIGALESEDSSIGFLHPRDGKTAKLSATENLFVRPFRKEWRQIYESSMLESRAWCLQERLLSTRIIQFTNTELLWECQTNAQRESYLVVDDTALIFASAQDSNQNKMKRALANLDVNPFNVGGALAVWHGLVQQYSRRDLTFASDMLRAISGIANELQSRTGFTYLHGLWKEDFRRGLLWQPGQLPGVKRPGIKAKLDFGSKPYKALTIHI